MGRVKITNTAMPRKLKSGSQKSPVARSRTADGVATVEAKKSNKGNKTTAKWTRNRRITKKSDNISSRVIDDRITKAILEDTPKRYRQREEMPDPTKRADHEVNKLDGKFQARADKALIQQFEDAAERLGLSKKEATEQALKAWLANHTP